MLTNELQLKQLPLFIPMADNHNMKYTEFYQTRKTTVTRPLSQASQYAAFLPAVYPSTSSFTSYTEHLLQIGNSDLKHLYLVFMKQE